MATRSQLGDLEELVLLAVLRLGENAYGAAIREELKQRADRSASVSTIYVTLMRLEEKGHVRSWMGEPTAERGGKAKRYFELRPEGVTALEATRTVRERMWEGMGAEVETHARGPGDVRCDTRDSGGRRLAGRVHPGPTGQHGRSGAGAAERLRRFQRDVVRRAGYGIAHLDHRIPITPETVFDIASISKQFGAVAALPTQETRARQRERGS